MYLAINTCESSGELAVLSPSSVIGSVRWEKDSPHSEVITEKYLELKKSLGINESQFLKIVCVNGPGSFTGIRVGVNFAKTLAYSNNIPICSLSTLELLSLRCPNTENKILSCVDAQKNSVFLSSYSFEKGFKKTIFENRVIEVSLLGEIINEPHSVCGSGFERYKKYLKPDVAAFLIENESWKTSQLSDLINYEFKKPFVWSELQPLYIKNSSAEEKNLQNGVKS